MVLGTNTRSIEQQIMEKVRLQTLGLVTAAGQVADFAPIVDTLTDDVATAQVAILRVDPGSAGNVGQELGNGPDGPKWNDTYFNVKTWASVQGDNVTDDTAQIQWLIDYISTTFGGGVIFLPRGTYRVTTLILKKGVTLTGFRGTMGYSNVGEVFIRGLTSDWVIDTPASLTMGIAVVGLIILGSSTATSGGAIQFREVNYSQVRNVTFANFRDQAVKVIDGNVVKVVDCFAFNCLMNRSRSANAGVVEVGGHDCYVQDCELTAGIAGQTDVTDSNLYLHALVISGTQNHISGVIAEISDCGILVSGSYNRFTNTRADFNFGHGWRISGGGNVFAACQAFANGRGALNTYIDYLVTGTGNAFSATNSKRSGVRRMKYGFQDLTSPADPDARNTYDLTCTSDAWLTAPFLVDNFSGSSPMVANHVIRPASGTPSIDVSSGGQVNFTGYTSPTVVTALTGGWTGRMLQIVGDPDVTIQANASIKTIAGGDLTLAANRIYLFANSNGVWQQAA